MKNITTAFQMQFEPKMMLAIYQQQDDDRCEVNTYVETFSFDQACRPVNRRPLSLEDNTVLFECVDQIRDNKRSFTQAEGILPANVLHVPTSTSGHLVWYTEPQKMHLMFADRTGIPNAVYPIPALLWQANCHKLYIYALHDTSRPTEKSTVYHAPFFNVYASGEVCMGTVSLSDLPYRHMEAFMEQWKQLFFGSYFSHTNFEDGVKGGMVKLWKGLHEMSDKFPVSKLKKVNIKIKKLLA